MRAGRAGRALWLMLALAPALMMASGAAAKSHLWRFKEVFSDVTGTIQYIEMEVTDPAGTEEWRTANQPLSSNENVFVIPSNLPMENTYLKSMLLATPAFAALPGAPTPDFILPSGFFDPSGDELRWRTTLDAYSFTSQQLPTDGIHALQRSDGSTPVNSPTNFAGQTGSVDASTAAVPGVWPPLMVTALIGAAVWWKLRQHGERSIV